MSLRRFPASLTALRGLAIAAIVCASVAAFTNAQFRYREFFSGVTVGILLVLVISLFSAHPAEVEAPPASLPPGNESGRTDLRK